MADENAVATTAKGTVSTDLRPYEQLVKKLTGIAELGDGSNGFEIAAAVIDNIAVAMTPEEIFGANESGPGDAADWLNQPIGLVGDPRVAKSDEKFRKGTLGVYLTIDFVTREGKQEMITVGAPNVVATVWRLYELEMFGPNRDPFWVEIRGRETANGTLYTVHAARDAG